MPGNRTHYAAPRTTQGRKRRASAMQNPVEEAHPSENGFAPLPEKRRARGSGVAIQPAHSRTLQKQNVAMNTVATSAKFHTQGASSSDTSRISSVKASTPDPQHQPLAFVKPEVDQVMDMMMVKDEAPHPQEAPELADIAWEDRESKQILQYNLHHRLHFLFVMNKDQVDLKKMEPFEATDSEFGNWTSLKILQFFATILPAKLMDIYKLFKFPSQLIEHLNSRELYINNQECQVFWYELIGMSDDDYDKVLKGLWKLKYGSEDGYEEWKGRDGYLEEQMNVGREEVVSLVYHRKEEDEEPKDRWSVHPEADLEEEDEKVEKQIVEEEEEFDLEPMLHQNSEEAPKYDAVPNGGQPAPELKMEQEEHCRILHAHAQEDFRLAPAAPTAPTIVSNAPALHEEQQWSPVPAPAPPVAYRAAPVQALPQVRPPLDAFRLDAERLSELLRLGILVLSPPADPARIEVQAPPQIVEQEVLAPAIPDAPPVVQAPLLGGWQQGLGVPAPAIPDAAVQAPPGWHQALGYWAPPPAAFQPIPEFPLQEEAYGQRFELCMEMRDILEKLAGAREQQVPELLAPAPQAAHPAVWAQQQFNGFMDIPPLVAPPPAHVQEQLEQLFPGINAPPPAAAPPPAHVQGQFRGREQQFPGFLAPPPVAAPPIPQRAQGLPQGVQQLFSPPLPAPAPIDQHLGVQAAHWSRQDQFSRFQAPPPAAVPPMDPRVQAPPPFHPHSHLVLVPRDGQPYAPPPYRPLLQ